MKRRKAAALVAAALIVSSGTAAAASRAHDFPAPTQPTAAVAFAQIADAVWIVRENRTGGTFYFAGALRMAPTTNGLETWGYVGRGKCTTHRDGNGSMTVCSGTGRGHRLEPTAFELHPLLDDAEMTLATRKHTHEIAWAGRGDTADGIASLQTGGTSLQAMAALARSARARGELFGERIDKGGGFSFLFQGVMAYAQLAALGYDFAPDGSLEVTKTFRY